MIRSTCQSNSEALKSIMALHCPSGFECDLTYGNGAFYKNVPEPLLKFDITPMVEGVIQSCSTATNLLTGSVSSCVVDPPFLTYITGGRDHKDGSVAMSKRFGGYYSYAQLESHYRGTLMECSRILMKKGVLVFKCQDIIHNHKMHCTHANVIVWASEFGFRLKDLFVLCAKHRMPGPQKGTQRHAKIWHSYFLVFELTKPNGSES